MSIRFRFFLLALCGSLAASAQNDTVYVQGHVVEKGGSQCVPFTLIYTLSGRICTSSNDEGFYRLAIPPSYNEPVVFSAFGYRRDTIPVAYLRKHPNVKLCPGGVELNPVTVTAFTPQGLLKEVLRRVPDNYQTDTTLNQYFSRYCYMLNDSVYLFYENVFESLRAGYGKFDKKRFFSFSHKRKEYGSNYNNILHSRLLVCDSDYLYGFLRNSNVVRDYLSYSDNASIMDPIEVPNAYKVFAKRKWDRYKMSLSEYDDSVGGAFYLLSIVDEDSNRFEVSVDKQTLAVTLIKAYEAMRTKSFPKGKIFRKRMPFASRSVLQHVSVFRYVPINGRYTLASINSFSDVVDTCHNEYRWQDAPSVWRFKRWRSLQLISQQPGDHHYFDSVDVLPPQKISFVDMQQVRGYYDKDYWKNINIVPLPVELESKVLKRILNTVSPTYE